MRFWFSLILLCLLSLSLGADAPVLSQKLKDQVGKPLTISGKTIDGKEISSEQFKGKVILVDFWATWCGPCVEELPHVRKVYDQYHEKGLEVIGVTSDFKLEPLRKFLSAHPEYAWRQLFDPNAAKEDEMHPITGTLGIDALPVMILIDKKGVCRSVTAASEMDQLIPMLLGE